MAQHIDPSTPLSLGQLVLYFLKLGTIGFGGPAALVGYMRKDLVDDGQRIDEQTYNLYRPGPDYAGSLAAQTAIAIGYFRGCWAPRWSGSPSSCPPSSWCSCSWLYVTFGGLPGCRPCFTASGPSSSPSSPWRPTAWRADQQA